MDKIFTWSITQNLAQNSVPAVNEAQNPVQQPLPVINVLQGVVQNPTPFILPHAGPRSLSDDTEWENHSMSSGNINSSGSFNEGTPLSAVSGEQFVSPEITFPLSPSSVGSLMEAPKYPITSEQVESVFGTSLRKLTLNDLLKRKGKLQEVRDEGFGGSSSSSADSSASVNGKVCSNLSWPSLSPLNKATSSSQSSTPVSGDEDEVVSSNRPDSLYRLLNEMVSRAEKSRGISDTYTYQNANYDNLSFCGAPVNNKSPSSSTSSSSGGGVFYGSGSDKLSINTLRSPGKYLLSGSQSSSSSSSGGGVFPKPSAKELSGETLDSPAPGKYSLPENRSSASMLSGGNILPRSPAGSLSLFSDSSASSQDVVLSGVHANRMRSTLISSQGKRDRTSEAECSLLNKREKGEIDSDLFCIKKRSQILQSGF